MKGESFKLWRHHFFKMTIKPSQGQNSKQQNT